MVSTSDWEVGYELIAFPVYCQDIPDTSLFFLMLNSLLQADEPSDEASLMDEYIQVDTFEEGFKGE